MKHLNGKYNVEVQEKRYILHPTKNVILRERRKPKSLRTQNQFIKDTQVGRSQKVIKMKEMIQKSVLIQKKSNVRNY